MFTTRSSTGKSKVDTPVTVDPTPQAESSDIVSGTPVEVVRFNGQFMVGRVLEPMSSISDGQRFRGGTVSLTYLNNTFLQIRFDKVDGKDTYSQLVPWAAVATVILK